MNLFLRWSRWNIRACDAIERQLPKAFTRSLLHQHELLSADVINSSPSLAILDVGSGKTTAFAHRRNPALQSWIVGTDILEDDLRSNNTVASRVVADASGLPFRDMSFDVITTRSVMEHLPDNARFVSECYRVLRQGGMMICVMPAKRAPFALLNRVLPEKVKRKLLFSIFPDWRDACGFRAFYDRCAWPEMGRTFEAAGFELKIIELRYYQSIYGKFCVPLFLLSLCYDLTLWRFSVERLCSQMLIAARRN